MKIRKAYIALGLMIASIFFFEFAAHADESNESTKVTFNAPIQIPGQVLPAGTYTLKQVDPDSDSNLLQIFSADRTVLYATVQTISAERREPTSDTSITLAQQGGSEPDVLVKWFYPGRTIGHEFVYPKQQEQAIAQDTQKTFVGDHVVFGGEATAGE
jgi:hypothetical protein